MADEAEREVPEGVAVFPLIPPELDVHPLLLATLHALVFLEGSADDVVHPAAAVEALEYLAGYLQRLSGPELERVRADLEVLTAFAQQQQWPKQQVRFLKTFLSDYGVGPEGEAR
jgi:hypothetical protein